MVHDCLQKTKDMGVVPTTRPIPTNLPRHLACALEGILNTGNKYLLVSCYLPQDIDAHVEACIALSALPSEYPPHLIILGGDFQGDWTSKSDR